MATETQQAATHSLSGVTVSRVTIVRKGANGKRWFLRKTAEPGPGVEFATPSALLKAAGDWSTAYVVVAAPGWVEQGGQGAEGIHDVWKSEADIEKAAHDYLAAGGDVNRLVHGSDTDPTLKVVESFVALADFEVGGEKIAKGSWCLGIRLDAEARAMVESGEITGVSIEGSGVREEIGKAAPSERSVMVALYPPAEVANALAIDGGEHPADLHLTLAYLGDVQDDRIHLVVDAVERALEGIDTDGLSGMISGAGTFAAGSGPGASKPVHYASVDAPALPALREAITTYLRSAGVPAREDHGFTPHVTLKYGGVATPRVEARPVSFPEVHVVRGDRDVATVALTPLRVPDAALAKVSARAPLETKPGKSDNWVERHGVGAVDGKGGGLPPFIDETARAIRDGGKTREQAIQFAIGTMRRWAAGGDNVKPDTRAKAVKALAQWEAMKARAKASSAIKKESIVSKIIDTLKKALASGEEGLDADERALIAKIAEEADPGSPDPAGTVRGTEHSEETEMDETKLAEALAKALEPTTKAIEEQGKEIAALKKAAEPAPETPTVESVAKDVDALAGGLVASLDQINKSLAALGAGSSTQAPERIEKNDGSGQSEWAKNDARGILGL